MYNSRFYMIIEDTKRTCVIARKLKVMGLYHLLLPYFAVLFKVYRYSHCKLYAASSTNFFKGTVNLNGNIKSI